MGRKKLKTREIGTTLVLSGLLILQWAVMTGDNIALVVATGSILGGIIMWHKIKNQTVELFK